MVRNNTAKTKKKLRKSTRKRVQAIRQLREHNEQEEENRRVVEEGRRAKKLARKGTLVNTDSEDDEEDITFNVSVSDALQKVRDLDSTTKVPDNVKKAKKSSDVTAEHVKKCFRLEAEFLEALKNVGECILFRFSFILLPFTCSHYCFFYYNQTLKMAKRNGTRLASSK